MQQDDESTSSEDEEDADSPEAAHHEVIPVCCMYFLMFLTELMPIKFVAPELMRPWPAPEVLLSSICECIPNILLLPLATQKTASQETALTHTQIMLAQE